MVTLLIESVMGSFWNSVFVSELENITDMAELCICVKKLEGWCRTKGDGRGHCDMSCPPDREMLRVTGRNSG